MLLFNECSVNIRFDLDWQAKSPNLHSDATAGTDCGEVDCDEESDDHGALSHVTETTAELRGVLSSSGRTTGRQGLSLDA